MCSMVMTTGSLTFPAICSCYQSVFTCLQGGIPGDHHLLCFCVLPVDTAQLVDDALDSLANRRGQPPAVLETA